MVLAPLIPSDHPLQFVLAALRIELERHWCADTSFWPDEWTPERPSFGQCAVTAMIVHDRVRGEILRTVNQGVLHYWNRVDGREVDLTRDQFDRWAPEEDIVTVDREYLGSSGPTIAARHRRLAAALVGLTFLVGKWHRDFPGRKVEVGTMDRIAPGDARAALEAADRAEQQVADEVGLPRGYWWGMAAGWVVLGTVGVVAPVWLAAIATLVFGVGHSVLASQLLGGRRRTSRLQVSATVAGRRTPVVVVGMLLGLVVITAGLGFALDADGASHAALWASVIMGFVVGVGGPEILRTLRRAFDA